ncbi:3-oxoacyl-ACP reductase FabG [Mycobacterium sp. C31M]
MNSQRVSLVTGSAQGIGAAIARKLAEGGCAVVLADLAVDKAQDVAQSIVNSGGKAIAVRCDVSNREDAEAAVQAAVDNYGSLDILVSNAGVTRDNLIHKMTDDDWDLVIATHLTGGFYMARAAQRVMVKNRYGKIVFISSGSAAGNRGQANYSAAKAGLQGMARTLALELGPFGINVNCVSPGHIDTEMTRAVAARLGLEYEDVAKDKIAANSIKRVGVPDDIANAVRYLVSDEAGYVTGQVVNVHGRPSL